MDASQKLSYYLFNGHGDVVQTVSAAGDVENRYEYDIFGMPTLTLETYTNAILYAGEFFDQETGLYYLRARYYNPHTGRFISEDSYWGEDRNPLSLNLYTYVSNDPLMYIDPTGHRQEKKAGDITPSSKPASGGTLLKVGSTGDQVKALQELLVKAGYKLETDGKFGKQTQAAVIDFQKTQNIQVDGIVGNQTLSVLRVSSSYRYQSVDLEEAKQAPVGAISSDRILMSSGQIDKVNQSLATKAKDAGPDSYVKHSVVNH